MSVEENIAVVRRQRDAVARGDIAAAIACDAPDALNHGRPASPDVMHRVLTSLHALQERATEEEIIAVGDKVVCRNTVHGSTRAHRGSLSTVAS